MKKNNIAHVREADNVSQSLETHLIEAADIAAALASKVGSAAAGELLGLIHDFGKYSDAFQDYINSATGRLNPDIDHEYVDAKSLKGKIDHSTAGAQWLWNELRKFGESGQGELCGQILALCIASHHGGLIDCLKTEESNGFNGRIGKADEKTHLKECTIKANESVLEKAKKLAGGDLVASMTSFIKEFLPERLGQPIELIKAFYLGFYTRFLFSCLVDADRLNSADFERPELARIRKNQSMDWNIAMTRLESRISDLPIEGDIDRIRREISDNCKAKAANPPGIYTLTVPTGGGKTYASLRFAIHHAQIHQMDRIIYIIPYTSIIEQNAKAIREVIEDEKDLFPWVLEHHSNLEPDQQTWHSKLASENWDAPIILTTMVQFLEALFSGGTRGVRRLHQLANSVLIFDEIQTLPIKCTHLFCNALNFLVRYCKTTALLCTATQPLLNELKTPGKGQLLIPEQNELAHNVRQLFDDLNRVEIQNVCKPGGWKAVEIVELALDQFNQSVSCLIIVNTKAWAQDLYRLLKEAAPDKEALFHLSTNQCPAHRKRLFDEIRRRLDARLPVLCVSTQLMEAGVDIDFACVIRFLAGLDAIAQSAGRCNRHGKLKDKSGNLIKGIVYVLNPESETIDSLTDIKAGRDKTLRILAEGHHGNLLNPDIIKLYFKYYFFDRADEMAYPLSAKQAERNDTLLNLLSDNPQNICTDNRPGKLPLLRQSFMTAGKCFQAIDAPTKGLIVQYGEGKTLVAELCAVNKKFEAKTFYDLLRKAQKWSVNVFPNVWEKLKQQKALLEIQGEGIYYLDERYYSEEFGLSTEPVSGLECLIS